MTQKVRTLAPYVELERQLFCAVDDRGLLDFEEADRLLNRADKSTLERLRRSISKREEDAMDREWPDYDLRDFFLEILACVDERLASLNRPSPKGS
jgi:hypothetical protein